MGTEDLFAFALYERRFNSSIRGANVRLLTGVTFRFVKYYKDTTFVTSTI